MLSLLPLDLWESIFSINTNQSITFADSWDGTYIRYKEWLRYITKIVIIAQSSKLMYEYMNAYLTVYQDMLIQFLCTNVRLPLFGKVFQKNDNKPFIAWILYLKKRILQVYCKDVHFKLELIPKVCIMSDSISFNTDCFDSPLGEYCEAQKNRSLRFAKGEYSAERLQTSAMHLATTNQNNQ